MAFEVWLLVIGALLLAMAILHPTVQRLPITSAVVYLVIGVWLGPSGIGAIHLDPVTQAVWLHRASEISVIISLFTVGLKLRLSPFDRQLRPALCLASVSMVATVGLVAVAAIYLLNLPLGAAILLGAVLAPTDPVLASDVQLRNPRDQDQLRLTLTAEGGLNDGTAFPFVMLGLGLLGLHDLGDHGWRWWTIDVVWAVLGGLSIGAAFGYALARLLFHLQAKRAKVVARGEYLVLGLIGVSYGTALQVHAYGFLAVFAAGLALRAAERRASSSEKFLETTMKAAESSTPADKLASNPKTAPAYFAGVLLATNELLEHILEVGVVLLVGAVIMTVGVNEDALWFAPLLFLLIRPLAVLPVLAVGKISLFEFGALSWFGVRGIGSIYYVMYAVGHGLPTDLAARLTSFTITLVALSIIVHGVSVTPFLARYGKRRPARRQQG